MSRRTGLTVLLWSVTAVAVGLEVWGAVAHTGATWTESLTTLPWWMVVPPILVLAVWLPYHFITRYLRKRRHR